MTDKTIQEKNDEAISKALAKHPLAKPQDELYPNLNNERLKLKDKSKPDALVADVAKVKTKQKEDYTKNNDELVK